MNKLVRKSDGSCFFNVAFKELEKNCSVECLVIPFFSHCTKQKTKNQKLKNFKQKHKTRSGIFERTLEKTK
jgi:hypothetical protein